MKQKAKFNVRQIVFFILFFIYNDKQPYWGHLLPANNIQIRPEKNSDFLHSAAINFPPIRTKVVNFSEF